MSTRNPVTFTPRIVVGPRLVTLAETAVSDASRSAGSVPPNGPNRELSSPSDVPVPSAIQDFPSGIVPLPLGNLMYAVGGMKISVIAVGFCMLIMPRECTKSYSPVAVYDTDMLCICVVMVIEILAVWPAVRVTAAVRLSGSAFVPQPAASTPTLTKTTTYQPRRIALPPFTPLRRPNSAVPGPGKQPISFFLALNRLDGW